MTKEKLKKMALEAIDNKAHELHEFTRDIYLNPELGYKEFRTTEKTVDFMKSLGLDVEENIAITGARASTGIKDGLPNLAMIGELDSVICHDHEDAGPDGACHACGHNIQLGVMLGTAVGLVDSGVIKHLDGSVDFMAVPAEEFLEIDYRAGLIEEGKISYAGGKQEMVHRGYFDKIDMALMMHSQGFEEGTKMKFVQASNGFIGKKINFIGREAHAGSSPHLGINALNAANLALNNIHAQRETFREEDRIRVHPIITKGGDIVNSVPADVKMESYVRGSSLEGILEANKKVNRALKAGAMAVGAKVEIQEIPGYLPLECSQDLYEAFYKNSLSFFDEKEIEKTGTMGGSTDFGDLTNIMPGIHPMIGGVSGAGHTRDYRLVDPDMAYIVPAKIFAMTIIDLLYDGAKEAKKIIENFEAKMTMEDYLNYLKDSSSKETFFFED